MTNDIITGLRVPSQLPLDTKIYCTTKTILLDLGVANNLAYTYYKGMIVYCANEREIYEWREQLVALEPRLLPADFTYPNGLIVNGINYSNKIYNFFKVLQATDVSIPVKGVVNVGTGVPVYDGFAITGGEIIEISSLKSNTIQIQKEVDGSITLEVAQNDFGYLKSFHINANYVPTINSPSDGSIIRPYVDFDQARTAFIGTGTIVNPEFAGGVIILQTSSNCALNPTVNNLTIEFQNFSQLTYLGTDTYMFDTEVLYPLVDKSVPRQNLAQDITMAIKGKGYLNRSGGIGLVRGVGSNRNGLAILTDKVCFITVGINSDDHIILKERIDYPAPIWDGDMTFANGTTLESFYGTPHKYSLKLLPTVPLVYTKFEAGQPFRGGVGFNGITSFQTVANTAIKIDSNSILTGGTFDFTCVGAFVSTTSATKMVDFPNHYRPHPNRNFVEGKGALYCNQVTINDAAGYATTGVDSFFKFTDNADFRFGVMNIKTNMYVNKFINLDDVTNTVNNFAISNNSNGSVIDIQFGRFFIDTTITPFSLVMPKTVVKPFVSKSETPVALVPFTEGTVSSFFGTPVISGIANYADDAAAGTAGLLQNSIYFNTTTNSLNII